MEDKDFMKRIFSIIYWFEETGYANKDIANLLRDLADEIEKGK